MGAFDNGVPLNLTFFPSGIYNKAERKFYLKFVFSATQNEDNKQIVKVFCDAEFEFKDSLDFDEIPDYFYPNSLAIVFPYVRSFVSAVTLLANIPTPILIPTLNLTALKDELKASTQNN